MYQILVIDLDNTCFAKVYSDGEIEKKWEHHSSVPHKHRKGGQSARRFTRIRENEITLWFKRINEYLKEISGEIIIGCNSIYYKRFYKHLSTTNKNKVVKRLSIEYTGLTGIYQLLKKIENGK